MDARENVVKKFEMLALNNVPANFISILSNFLLCALEDYEIVPRCTDVAVINTENDDILKMYVASMLVENKSTGTIKQYVDVLRRFECFVNKNFTECTSIDLRRYIAHVMSSGASSTTCNNYRSYICSFYSWMEQEEYMDQERMEEVLKLSKVMHEYVATEMPERTLFLRHSAEEIEMIKEAMEQ